MRNTYIPSYVIKSNSTLIGKIPMYISNEIDSITDVYKIGTTNKEKVSTNGEVSFKVENETSPSNIIKFIEFNYKASRSYVGDDSFEFTINYKDGT